MIFIDGQHRPVNTPSSKALNYIHVLVWSIFKLALKNTKLSRILFKVLEEDDFESYSDDFESDGEHTNVPQEDNSQNPNFDSFHLNDYISTKDISGKSLEDRKYEIHSERPTPPHDKTFHIYIITDNIFIFYFIKQHDTLCLLYLCEDKFFILELK
uniref:Reverse transcriptase domain-containing protein n=1 Tax=Heterorhabditis bacteriophora TaxID=37862 RepID=A0A1I7WR81_HETBA